MDDIDSFLDDCERILLKDHDLSDSVFSANIQCLHPQLIPILVDPFFPLSPSAAEEWISSKSTERHTYAHWTGPTIPPSSISTNVPNKNLPSLPGEHLRLYDPDDSAGILPHDYAILMRCCAAFVGVPEEHLAKCVAVHETKLEKIRLMRLERDKRESGRLSRGGSGVGELRKSKSAGGLRVAAGEVNMDDASPVTS